METVMEKSRSIFYVKDSVFEDYEKKIYFQLKYDCVILQSGFEKYDNGNPSAYWAKIESY